MELSSNTKSKAIRKHNGSVVLASEVTGQAKSVSMSMEASSIKGIAKSSSGSLRFETNHGIVRILNKAITSISEQVGRLDVKMMVESKAAQDGSLANKETQHAVIVEIGIGISSSGRNITTFGGNALNVSIPVSSNFKVGEKHKVIVMSAHGSA